MTETEPILMAIQQQTDSGKPISGRYNVWRYDTPSTICVAWGIEAADTKDAFNKAMEQIKSVS